MIFLFALGRTVSKIEGSKGMLPLSTLFIGGHFEFLKINKFSVGL